MKPRRLWPFTGGLKLPAHKHEATHAPIGQLPLPAHLILPLQQPIGEPPKSVVKVGDRVLKGQVIAQSEGSLSVPVHASSSGQVIAIEDFPIPHPSNLCAPCIVIATDGQETWIDRQPVVDYQTLAPSHLCHLIHQAGIVGLGGAGFPTALKLNPGSAPPIETLILNGAECEPHISCDDLLMRERAEEIIKGIKVMGHALQAQHCLIGIEDDKPAAYAALLAATATVKEIEVVPIPTCYPAGGEKQLIKVLTGKEVPSHGFPFQQGVVCHNVGTAAAVHRAINCGEPLLSRIVTVTGKAVAHPCNLDVLLGTPAHHALTHCGTDFDNLERLIMGGPMMGFTLNDASVPVIKTTNCLLAGLPQAALPSPPMPCIRCGACSDVCPAQLLPQQIYWYTRAKELDKARDYHLFDCIECGCCAYVCPSHIPLVHYYRYAKGEIRTQEQERQKAVQARQRHEARQQRLAREQAEKAAQQRAKKALVASTTNQETKRATIQAAVERAQAKKRATQKEATEKASVPPSRQSPP
jgi:Na+-translocating ferredoxin:NAD+ oxidoreductase subunit C